ncbi:hypothetical protein [Halorarum salinum]|uniref:Uncharacterized protein n=1 Tax=Halorarum salinum TaxID=2743089 RepID=A0A7D5L9F7_9EURY|nr:hypothetical protein [Halobaculum salinum]QLG60829.1 hypothetical protein HUG12_03330 [Halobaculum salinum]
MTEVNEFVLLHADRRVAAAVGQLLTGGESVEKIADEFAVAPETVENAIVESGLTEHVAGIHLNSEVDQQQQRKPPTFLQNGEPITRQKQGIRDETAKEKVSPTYEVSFTRAVLSEASQKARELVSQQVSQEFGEDATRLRVAVRATPTDQEFPDHVRWIAVEYPVDASKSSSPGMIQSPPFQFSQLEEFLPDTIDVTVELSGETFSVRNIPVAATEERWE